MSLAKSYPCRDPPLTFILEEVAHARTAGEDELGDVLDDFGLVFGRERGEPLGQALRASADDYMSQGEVPTTLPCRESRMRYLWGPLARGSNLQCSAAACAQC